MNIKEKIEELVEKIKNDKDLLKKFQSDPVKTIEDLVGVDLPNDQIEAMAEAIKAKISLDKLGGALGSLFGKK